MAAFLGQLGPLAVVLRGDGCGAVVNCIRMFKSTRLLGRGGANEFPPSLTSHVTSLFEAEASPASVAKAGRPNAHVWQMWRGDAGDGACPWRGAAGPLAPLGGSQPSASRDLLEDLSASLCVMTGKMLLCGQPVC